MIIKTKIELREYLKLCYYMTFRRPGMIILCIVLLFGIVMDVIIYSGIETIPMDYPFSLALCIPIILISFSLYVNGKNNFRSNKKIQEIVIYEFGTDKMISKGESFTSESTLNTLFSVKETDNWFLVYQSKQVANLIPKKEMTEAEVIGLRGIFRSVSGIKLKLKG